MLACIARSSTRSSASTSDGVRPAAALRAATAAMPPSRAACTTSSAAVA